MAVVSPNCNCRDRTHGHVSASRQLHPPRLKVFQTSLLEITANSAHGEEISQTNQTKKARFHTFLGTGHFARFTLLPMWEYRNKLLLLLKYHPESGQGASFCLLQSNNSWLLSEKWTNSTFLGAIDRQFYFNLEETVFSNDLNM